jgi:hypothetical protein
MDWKVIYIIEKLLELKCLKWVCITHLDIKNISYGQKKGWELNRQFDSRPLKVGNRPNFLMCRWRVTYCWKAFNKSYKFSLDFISIAGLHTKLWAPKVVRVLAVGILRFPLGNPETKCHLDASHKLYYKGEGGDFPQIRAMVSFMSPSLPMVHPNTKSVSTMH